MTASDPTPPAAGAAVDATGGDVLPLDPRSLRALAHPLRMRLLSALRDHGPATASSLAARLGESSGATSYHLRQLAAHGFVEDDPDRGNGRERWWRAVHRGTSLDTARNFLDHPDPEVRGALDTYLHEVATDHAAQLGTWLGTLQDWPDAWRESGDLSSFTLRLTPELAAELGAKVHALIESYRGLLPEPPAGEHPRSPAADGSATVRLHFHAFPRQAD
ncbi:helix-turn-helix domain-containing protein [Streptomyces sp. V4-01]|uniref:Helix-turn-helix domain-containing protein n=1 Tax=Actinacidiphila polyblastidii TaxID=3110430 RepID=A0ABU7P8Q8_9ACTN|nr:helix-turn-helix domain-containing protein [Streptomyces sp. V4-01]